MGNVIKIKHGSAAPKESQLQQYELGVQNGYLFIGGSGTSTTTVCSKIKAGFADSATSATKWTTARTLQTNLASSSATSVDGSANKEIGVKGILPIAYGGTGLGTQTANRLCWTNSDSKITSDNHYADASLVCINTTGHSDITSGLKVNGTILSSGNVKLTTTNSGYYLKDCASNAYAALYDSGENLWIGAVQGQAYHHKGYTYISAGHNGSSAYTTIKIAVPKTLSATAASYEAPTYYNVLHEGNWDDYITLPTVTDNKTKQTKSVTTNWRPLLSHYTDVSAYSTDPGDATGSVHYTPGIAVQPSTKSLTIGGTLTAHGSLDVKGKLSGGALFLGVSDDDAGHSWTGYGTSAPTDVTAVLGRVYFQYIS